MRSDPFCSTLTRSEHGTITFLSQQFFAKGPRPRSERRCYNGENLLASNPGPRKAWTLSTTFTLVALGGRAIQTLEQVLCLSQIGIEFQHAQDIVARTIDLPRTTKHPRDIHSNAALA